MHAKKTWRTQGLNIASAWRGFEEAILICFFERPDADGRPQPRPGKAEMRLQGEHHIMIKACGIIQMSTCLD